MLGHSFFSRDNTNKTPQSKSKRYRPSTRGLHLEPLEERQMLAVTLHVDADAPAGGTGLAWNTAYSDLQDALTEAEVRNLDGDADNDVDAIWIAEGTYKPSALLEEGDSRSASFSLVDGVALYGGFAGHETSVAERDGASHVVRLSGDLGALEDAVDNAYTVVFCAEDVEAALDSLTIVGGNANADHASSSHQERILGGGVFSAGTLTITSTALQGNSADATGGAIVNGGALVMSGCSLSGNRANRGGAIVNAGTLTLQHSVVADNFAEMMGGALLTTGTTPAFIVDCSFLGNSATRAAGDGGAIFSYGPLQLLDSTFSENSARKGGAICSEGTLSLDACLLDGNSALWWGGGIHADDSATITGSTLVGNSAGSGGAIYSTGRVDVVSTSIVENIADSAGGIRSSGELAVVNSTLWKNQGAHGFGGAIEVFGIARLSNSTVSSNVATQGAGVYVGTNSSMDISNSTLSENRAILPNGRGGGICTFGEVSINNSIVAQNTGSVASDVYYDDTSGGSMGGRNNLIGDGTGQSALVDGVDYNQVGTSASPVDPMLSGVRQFGNGQWGYRPLHGSPVKDAGDSALRSIDTFDLDGDGDTSELVPIDLAGNPRIASGTIDIGAVEAPEPSPDNIGVVRNEDFFDDVYDWHLDTNLDPWPEIDMDYGLASTDPLRPQPDVLVTGRWDASLNGDYPGAVREQYNSTYDRSYLYWYLAHDTDPGHDNEAFFFGFAGDTPVVGDWNGDDVDEIGTVRKNPDGYLDWYLDTDGDRDPTPELNGYRFGFTDDIPVVGDWDGDGIDNIGVVRRAEGGLLHWYLDTDYDGNGAWDIQYIFGAHSQASQPDHIPVVGDWNGDGVDNIGTVLEQNGGLRWFFKTTYDLNPNADSEIWPHGVAGDIPVVGKWSMPEIQVTWEVPPEWEPLYGDTMNVLSNATRHGTILPQSRRTIYDPPVTKTFYLTNTGSAQLDLSDLSLPTDFSVVDPLADSLMPGETDTFTVQFDGVLGDYGTICFNTSDGNESPFAIQIGQLGHGGPGNPGPGQSDPYLSLKVNGSEVNDGDEVPFGQIELDASTTPKSFVIHNPSAADLEVTSIDVTGGQFSLVEDIDGTITVSPHDSFTFHVDIDNSSADKKAGQVTIVSNDGGVADTQLVVDLTGFVYVSDLGEPEITLYVLQTTGPPKPVLDDGTVNFLWVFADAQGKGKSKTFLVRNDGDAPLNLGTVNISPFQFGWSIPGQPFVLEQSLSEYVLAPDEEATFTIRLDAARAGYDSGAGISIVSIDNNDDNEDPFQFRIKGFVKERPDGPPTDPIVAVHYFSLDEDRTLTDTTDRTSENFSASDIVRLSVRQSGKYEFAPYFKGRDHDLTTNDEDIDAFAIRQDGSILVSTKGLFTVPRASGGSFSGDGGDLLLWNALTQSWSMFDERLNADLLGKNIDAVMQWGSGGIALSLAEDSYTQPLVGKDKDLIVWKADGSWSTLIEGSDYDLFAVGEDIDAASYSSGGFHLSTTGLLTAGSDPSVTGADRDVHTVTSDGAWDPVPKLSGSAFKISAGIDGYQCGSLVISGPRLADSKFSRTVAGLDASALGLQFDKELDLWSIDPSGVTLFALNPGALVAAATAQTEVAFATASASQEIEIPVDDVAVWDNSSIVVMTEETVSSRGLRVILDPSIIVDNQGNSSANTIVQDILLPLEGEALVAIHLQPASDTGISDIDGLTYINEPVFDVTVTGPGTIEVDLDGDGTADLSPMTVESAGTYEIAATSLADGQHTVFARFTPEAGLQAQHSVQITIDTQGPSLLPGTANVGLPYSERTVTFSEPIDPNTISADAFSLSGPGIDGSASVATLTGAGDTYVLTFEPLADPGQFQLTAAPTIMDAAGNPMDLTARMDTFSTGIPQLGFQLLEHLSLSHGSIYHVFETLHNGTLTLQVDTPALLNSAQFRLYDADPVATPGLTPLAQSAPDNDGNQRIDLPVASGETYYVEVFGDNTDFNLRIANLVHHDPATGALTVHGTDDDDTFKFFGHDARDITINGVAYHYEDTEVTTVEFTGGEGFDDAWLYDSTGDETLEAWPDRAVFSNDGDDAIANFTVNVSGIESLLAYATRGGTDTATLHGSETADKLKSYEDSVRLRAKDNSYASRAKQFDTITSDSGTDGNDLAVFNGTDGDETFEYRGAQQTARIQGADRNHAAIGFGSVVARAGGGDNDQANFFDTADDDVLYFKSHKTVLVSPDARITVRAFDAAHAVAEAGGLDVARMYDTSADEHLEVSGDTARLYRKSGNEMALLYEAIGFERVKAYSTEGDDSKDIQQHAIDLLLTGWDT